MLSWSWLQRDSEIFLRRFVSQWCPRRWGDVLPDSSFHRRRFGRWLRFFSSPPSYLLRQTTPTKWGHCQSCLVPEFVFHASKDFIHLPATEDCSSALRSSLLLSSALACRLMVVTAILHLIVIMVEVLQNLWKSVFHIQFLCFWKVPGVNFLFCFSNLFFWNFSIFISFRRLCHRRCFLGKGQGHLMKKPRSRALHLAPARNSPSLLSWQRWSSP